MGESRRISTRLLGLAARLLLALVLFAAPYAQVASANFTFADADHHMTISADTNGHPASVHGHSRGETAEDTVSEADGAALPFAATAEKCCDLFCAGVACIVPFYGLASREPIVVTHMLVDTNVAPGEWVLPHRPPNT